MFRDFFVSSRHGSLFLKWNDLSSFVKGGNAYDDGPYLAGFSHSLRKPKAEGDDSQKLWLFCRHSALCILQLYLYASRSSRASRNTSKRSTSDKRGRLSGAGVRIQRNESSFLSLTSSLAAFYTTCIKILVIFY